MKLLTTVIALVGLCMGYMTEVIGFPKDCDESKVIHRLLKTASAETISVQRDSNGSPVGNSIIRRRRRNCKSCCKKSMAANQTAKPNAL